MSIDILSAFRGEISRGATQIKPAWQATNHDEIERLFARLPRALRVLEAPFGDGRFVPLYQQRGDQVYALGSSEECFADARARLGDQMTNIRTVAVTGALAQMPFQTGEFDLVVSTWMLGDHETAEEVATCLGDLARVTSKYAVIQMREADPAKARGRKESLPTARDNAQSLAAVGLSVVEKRLVRPDMTDGSLVNILLCEKA